MVASCSAIPKRGRKRRDIVSEENRTAIARNGSPVHGHSLVTDNQTQSNSRGSSSNLWRWQNDATVSVAIVSIEHASTNMVSVFRVLRSGCPVSRSSLRRKDEQRISRVAGEQLQRFEASKRTSMQSERVYTDMVHLELVEGKSPESSRARRFTIARPPWLFDFAI